MAYNYSLSEFSGLKYFFEMMWGDINKFNKVTRDNLTNLLKYDYKMFYKYLKNDFETNILYEYSASSLLDASNKELFFSDGSYINFKYNKSITKEREINITKHDMRLYYTERVLTDEIDYTKLNSAFVANLIQASDALYSRKYLNTSTKLNLSNIITIHDCFSIPGYEICHAIDIFNDIFKHNILSSNILPIKNNHLLLSAYSIFIVL
jgi:hypothetical protein